MATLRQKRAVKLLSENVGMSMGEAMRKAGYSVSTSKSPKRLTERKSFEEICDEAGLTDQLLTTALADDIEAKPKRRVAELSLAADILGRKKNRVEMTGKDGGAIEVANLEKLQKLMRRIAEK